MNWRWRLSNATASVRALLAPCDSSDAAARFWYLSERREPRRIVVRHAQPGGGVGLLTGYPMNYTSKVSFPRDPSLGLVRLRYPNPIGMQFNPEAAAIELLGRWNAALCMSSRLSSLSDFHNGADALLVMQDSEGRFPYSFDWHGLSAPWYSALAQTRCASVFARAWSAFGASEYRTACLGCLKSLRVDEFAGGVRSSQSQEIGAFATEYSRSPIGVLNGLMAVVIGLLDVESICPSPMVPPLIEENAAALRRAVPRCEIRGWSRYQFLGPQWRMNVQSPRYHRMCCDYLAIIGSLKHDPWFAERSLRWQSMVSGPKLAEAYLRKAAFKLIYR